MKKLITSLLLVMTLSVAHAQQSPVKRMNPTNWWVGMKSPELQVLFYGDKLATHTLTLKPYKGVVLKKVHKVENPNYLFADLEIRPDARAGKLEFVFTSGKSTVTQTYELRPKNPYQPKGVSPADFVYLLMPDRFANGDPSNDKFADMADPLMDRTSPWLRHGGDLQGITNRLDYFTDLGVTALWLNPVIENDQPTTDEGGTKRSAYHGYGFAHQ